MESFPVFQKCIGFIIFLSFTALVYSNCKKNKKNTEEAKTSNAFIGLLVIFDFPVRSVALWKPKLIPY